MPTYLRKSLALALALALLFTFAGCVSAQQMCLCQAGLTTPLPTVFFGMDMLSSLSGNLPTISFGAMRGWDNGCTWPDIEQSPGVYTWTCFDNMINNAATAGVDLMWTMYGTPVLSGYNSNPTASCSNSAGYCSPPSDLATTDQHWKNFVTAAVQHSKASAHPIKFYNTSNEPNTGNYWNGTIPQLVTLVNDAAAIIHAQDTSAIVIGPSPTSNNPAAWLTTFYADGGIDDYSSFHCSSNQATNTSNLTAILAVPGIKPNVWGTECDWGSAQDASFTSDQKNAFLGQQAFLMDSAGIKRWYLYAWPTNSTANYCTGSLPCVATAWGNAISVLYGWMVGETHNIATPMCATVSTTTTCSFNYQGTASAEVLWDTAATPTVTVPSGYTTQFNLDGTSSAISGHQVTLGIKPIMVK